MSLDTLPREELQEFLQRKADKKELQELAVRLSITNGAEYEDSLSYIIARKQLQPVLRCLSCDHPLPMKKVKQVEERADWQVLGIDHCSPKRKTQDDILVGSKSDVIYERDPLLLQDGQMLSRYPRMMPPPNRVRTAVGGGGLGLNTREKMKEKLQQRKAAEAEKLQSPPRRQQQQPHV